MNKKQKRIKRYNCDGNCYMNKSICPRIEYCPETRVREFWATVVAVLVILSIPIAMVGLIIYMLFGYL